MALFFKPGLDTWLTIHFIRLSPQLPPLRQPTDVTELKLLNSGDWQAGDQSGLTAGLAGEHFSFAIFFPFKTYCSAQPTGRNIFVLLSSRIWVKPGQEAVIDNYNKSIGWTTSSRRNFWSGSVQSNHPQLLPPFPPIAGFWPNTSLPCCTPAITI